MTRGANRIRSATEGFMTAVTFGKKWMFIAAAFLSAGAAWSALPAPWLTADIGSVGIAGSGNESGGTFTLAGSGADIWNTADAFRYVHQRLNGNTQVIVRVSSMSNTNAWAKAGIMIRETLTAGSRYASVFITPGNGVTFQSRIVTGGVSTSAITAGIAAPCYLKLARSGNQFAAFRSADGNTWTQIGAARTVDMDPVLFAGPAVTSHNNPALCTAVFTNVQFKAPPVLFVAASSLLNAGDAAAKKRLEALGYAVTVKAAAATVSTDANGKDLVVVSSTIASADVNTKFRTVAVPVLTWENAILDDMGMTGTVGGTDYGTTAGQTQATIYPAVCNRSTMYTAATAWGDGCHDMTGGLTGTIGLTRSASTFAWGVPNANAVKIAYHAGNASRAVVFGYDKGAVMPGLTAPARRVFLYMDDNAPAGWTPRGQNLFDNAVYWATNTKYSLVRKVLVMNWSPILNSQGGVRLDQYGASHWGWKDPVALARNYLADITEASGGYVRWKWATFPDVPAYLNRWVQLTGSEQYNSATFTEQDYIDAYNIGVNTGDWGAAGRAMAGGGLYGADYVGMLSYYNVEAKVQAGDVDEVLFYAHPFGQLNESAMAGDQAYSVNYGPIVWRPGIRNFMIMGLNYEWGLNEALQAFGRRSESLLGEHVYRNSMETIPNNPCYWPDFPAGDYCGTTRPATPQRNIYDRFSVTDGNLTGSAGVGATLWGPNSRNRSDQYDQALTNQAYSQADDWQFNYPLLIGAATKRLVSAGEWTGYAQDGNSGRGFKKWMQLHYPRLPGLYKDAANATNNNKLNNWWEYVVDFNKHPETQN
ncbi:MAG: C-terminal target protein [Fibrobacteres bacterium]|nr:C-terminal target protein [Fibrobacterota bacterium]